jgi:glycerol-3-phosphate dehydrogenase
LRYLEHYEFRLVREALGEREVLLAKAPHIVRPLRFVLPHGAGMRPAWMLRVGLFLYDHLGRRRRLPGSTALDLTSDAAGEPLKAEFRHGFAFYDCWVDDARLVVLNAIQAAEQGARVLTRHRLIAAARADDLWRAEVLDRRGGVTLTLTARALVNAAGPWVARLLHEALGLHTGDEVRLVKGSHIVVPRLHDSDDAYILQHRDGRVVFVLPYEADYSLIGTTDVAFTGDPSTVAIDPAETDYLIGAVEQYFRRPPAAADVVWSYAGVRPLHDDQEENLSEVSRDYVLDLDAGAGAAPVLSVFGGKITTYRRLAEEALAMLGPHLPGMGRPWTAATPLPGGDLDPNQLAALVAELAHERPGIGLGYLRRLVSRHGSRVRAVLGESRTDAELGLDFGAGLRAREVDYLRAEEWAVTADDVLWRRTKCGLHLGLEARRAVEAYLAGEAAPAASTSA